MTARPDWADIRIRFNLAASYIVIGLACVVVAWWATLDAAFTTFKYSLLPRVARWCGFHLEEFDER